MLGKIRSLLEHLSLEEELAEFAERNAAGWERFRTSVPEANRWTVINTLGGPIPTVAAGIFANHYAEFHETKLATVLNYRFDRSQRRLSESFGPHAVEFRSELGRHPGRYWRARRDAKRLFEGLETPRDLFTLRYEGVRIGDLVYNSFLRKTGHCTIEDLSSAQRPYLFRAILAKRTYDHLFEQYPPAALITGDIYYTQLGVPTRVAIDHEAEVFVDISRGGRKLGMKRLSDHDDVFVPHLRPDEGLFDGLWRDRGSAIAEEGWELIQNRMFEDNAVERKGFQDAYDDGKRRLTEAEFYEGSGLDPEAPTVVIMAHAFNDAPTLDDQQLFGDYYDWLKQTLEFVATEPGANWVVKEHPRTEAYECQCRVEEMIEAATAGVDSHTIYQLPNDVNTATVGEIANVLVTVRGTAGLEFACLGIPSLLAGLSRYSGFGFTTEPETRDAYFDLLSTPGAIDPLTDEQRDRARAMLAFQREYMSVDAALIPPIDQAGRGWLRLDWDAVPAEGGQIEPTADSSYRKLQQFLEADLDHTIDYQLP